MGVPHPMWRGFWLAAAMAAGMILLGFTEALAPFLLKRRMIAWAGAAVVGAFLASLPSRLRRKRRRAPLKWQRCLRGFLCGAGMALALGLAGESYLLPGLLTGSAGAAAFTLMALLAGFATRRLLERRRP